MKISKYRQWGIQIYWLLAMLYWEVLTHMGMFGRLDSKFIYAIGFSAALALAGGALVSFLPSKAVLPVSAFLSVVVMVLYGSQMVYCFIFGTPYSVSQIGLGADAVTSFWRETLHSMQEHLPWLLAMLAPLALLLWMHRAGFLQRPNRTCRTCALALALGLTLGTAAAVRSGGTEMYSDYFFFANSGSTTAQTMERYGVPTTFLLEYLRPEKDDLLLDDNLFLSMDVAASLDQTEAKIEETLSPETEPPLEEIQPVTETESMAETESAKVQSPRKLTLSKVSSRPAHQAEPTEVPETTAETEAPELVEEPTVPEETEPAYNVMDIDFDKLAQEAGNSRLAVLHQRFSQISPTNKNEYTGKFRDYNLIVICAESFSPAALDPKITPTLYKLAHEGFVFNNYYNSFPNTTTNGEYALTQGLYPDSTRDKYNSSMRASYKNTLPFTLGNAFASQLDIQSHGYHNYTRDYYSRYLTHPNMGYEMKFNHDGMELTTTWPNSDLEMMEQSIDDYIDEPQFHAYYMTFSGHYQYNADVNAMVAKNYDAVKDIPGYNTIQKGYLACHIELDKAMEYLLQRLEEKGIADKTVIVMASDHYPYGIPESDYFDMLGLEKTDFGKYKSTLIFWVGGMEPVEVDTYCCNVDILPTLLNMWGLEYDSRLLSGVDIFSDSVHMAVLMDRSFLTDKVWFNSNKRKTTYLVEESEVPEGYVDNMNKLISMRFELAKEIVRNDYYGILFPEN